MKNWRFSTNTSLFENDTRYGHYGAIVTREDEWKHTIYRMIQFLMTVCDP